MLGDHGLRLKGCRFYEGAVHVPLVVSWPARVRQNLRSDALVELVDLVPTLLEATGQPIPDAVQGRSLLPILSGASDPSVHREFVRCEYHDALDRPFASHANMLRNDRFKLVLYHGHEIGELYDLERDPGEYENLWGRPEVASLQAELTKQLFDAVMLATDPGQPRIGRF
jgi:arylsulfatase A-like enzyme